VDTPMNRKETTLSLREIFDVVTTIKIHIVCAAKLAIMSFFYPYVEVIVVSSYGFR
jgi:hypothetical protein